MRLLLDTHTLFWSADDPTRLSPVALAAIQDPANDRLLSAATIWELAIKVGMGKMTLSLPYRQWIKSQPSRSLGRAL
jgi:PIN domain nuclease of toxin-antitoxin system